MTIFQTSFTFSIKINNNEIFQNYVNRLYEIHLVGDGIDKKEKPL